MAFASPNQCTMGALGPNGEIYRPVIYPTPNYSPEQDAEKLRKAMKGFGTDEKGLIQVLCHRTAAERAKITKCFKSMYGKDLIKDIKSETSGDFCKLLCYLCYDAATLRAKILFDSIEGAGTDEHGIVEVLCSATNNEINEINDAYRRVLEMKGKNTNSRNLEKDLMGDTSGFFKRLMVSLVQAERREPSPELFQRAIKEGVEILIDRENAKSQAQKLYNAGEGKVGTDEAMFIQILGHESVWQLAAIDQAYKDLSKRTLREAIKRETSGSFGDALKACLDFALDRPGAFATHLYNAMKGAGTRDSTLIRICALRADIDMVEIKEAYARLYGKTLHDAIRSETSGDYRNALLALIGS